MIVLTPIIIKKVKQEILRIHTISDAIEFAFTFRVLTFSINPSQVKYEIRKLLELLKETNPKLILEIGTAGGGSLMLFSCVADAEATIISVDLPWVSFGGGYPEWKIPIYQVFAKNRQMIKLLRANSHDPETLELVKTIADHGMVDFLFIDGDHTYGGVKMDFEMYSPLVKKGGIIAFHDIVPGPIQNVGGVPEYWSEIKQKFNYVEIVDSWHQAGYGIGVIYL